MGLSLRFIVEMCFYYYYYYYYEPVSLKGRDMCYQEIVIVIVILDNTRPDSSH